jgi:hypothetical protein
VCVWCGGSCHLSLQLCSSAAGFNSSACARARPAGYAAPTMAASTTDVHASADVFVADWRVLTNMPFFLPQPCVVLLQSSSAAWASTGPMTYP